MTGVPERIWLQHSSPFDPNEENTWADRPVGETGAETEYVRVDLYTAAMDKIDELESEIQHFSNHYSKPPKGE